ncbi:hypothetical protein EMCRGX_G028440 [Ephydatia muelleri]|eukprot:Em0020g207a
MAATQDSTGFHRVASASTPVSETPLHYSYLKEFRTEQCKAFLQHKCNQHRPFTCFNWHFVNQRRRRSVKRRDGSFNYSPDIYCNLYDENTGICPNGEDCPYLHRNAGDTERRYHLRYYKTSTCVYETDLRGYCVKNGPHCAFAHGAYDLRIPIYDSKEGEEETTKLVAPLVGSLEKERGVLVDDPRWQDSSFVLTYYKTEQCRRPPRLCRQGYACPFFHNNKDRRRSPKCYKYRSTPCPNVKLNDEWGDLVNCEQGDSCCYCHTRTEQQFHPEIYKSTKCNDVQQTGYCPRGPFCAFAHDEKELTAPRELTDAPMTSTPSPVVVMNNNGSMDGDHLCGSPYAKSLPQPIGRPERAERPPSTLENFQRAPGAEVKSRSFEEDSQMYLWNKMQSIESDINFDENDKMRKKKGVPIQQHQLLRAPFGRGTMSPEGMLQNQSLPSPVSDALEVMAGGALDDLTVGDLDSAAGLHNEVQTSSDMLRGSNMIRQSPGEQGFAPPFQPQLTVTTSYPYGANQLGSFSPYNQPVRSAFNNLLAHDWSDASAQLSVGPTYGSSPKQSPLYHAVMDSPTEKVEMLTLKEELQHTKASLSSWQDSWKQATEACDAWKKEAEDNSCRAKGEKEEAFKVIDELQKKVQGLELKVESLQGGALQALTPQAALETMPLSQLVQLQKQFRQDLSHIETCVSQRLALLCVACKELPRCVVFQPCQHLVLCEKCVEGLGKEPKCPHCGTRVTQCSTAIIPV